MISRAMVLTSAFLVSGSLPCIAADGKPKERGTSGLRDSIAPAKAARSQGEALRLCRREDLPALVGADKVLVETASWAGATKAAITNVADLKALRAALTIEEVPPSGGETWATLTWLKGESVIRKAWVYDYGEWGFERPSVNWTIGRSKALVVFLKKHLTTAGPASRARLPQSSPSRQEPAARESPQTR